MKSSNLAYRMDRDDAEIPAPDIPAPQTTARHRIEARAAQKRARQRASFGFRAIVIRDQGFRPFRVR
jgi:hypothetical protein